MDLYENALKTLAHEIGFRIEQEEYDKLNQAHATPEKALALTLTCSSPGSRLTFDKLVKGFQRFVQPVYHFSTVIDTMSQANAIGSLTWGPIKFVLIVAKDVHETSVLVVKKLEWIADQLSTIDIFGDILASEPGNRLWTPCIKITVEIFIFCILARRFAEGGIFSRVYDTGSTRKSIQKCVDTVTEQLAIVNSLATGLNYTELRNIGATMLSSVAGRNSADIRADEKYRNVPGLLSSRYTGREAEEQWIQETLDKCEAAQGQRRAAIFGMTGSGKSQVMLRWDYTHRQTYDHALWITAGSQEKLWNSLQEVLDILNLPARLRPERHVKLGAIRRWLERTDKWLLMFDNVSEKEHYTIADIVPTTNNGDVLFTSQRPGAMEKLAGDFAFCRDLQLLDEETARKLFLKGLQSCRAIEGVEQTKLDSYIKDIVKTVGYLPHAIDAAAAYLKATDIDLPTFMDRLKTDSGRQKIYNFENQYAPDPERTTVARPFYLSLREIENKYPPVTNVLRLFSLFEPERIPPLQLRDWLRDDKASLERHKRSKGLRPSFLRKIFRKSVCAPATSTGQLQDSSNFQKSNVESALTKLVEYSLIRKLPEQHGAIWMHDLTRHHARSEIPTADMPRWLIKAVDVLYHTFPMKNSTPEERQIVDLFLPQAESIIAQCRTHNVPAENYAKLLAICGLCHHIHGTFNSAVASYESARPVFETVLGRSHHQTVTLKHRIGWSKRELGDLKLCEQYHTETHKLRSKEFGPNHEATLDAMSDLAFTIERSGRLKQGENLFKQCYEAEKLVRGTTHVRTLCCAHNLALCYANQGRLDEAVPMYKLVLENSKNVDASNHGRLKTLSCLAVAVDHQGYLDEAADLNRQALEGYEKKFGKDHLLTLRVRCNLSGLRRTQGKYAEAEALLKDARPVYERVLGTDHFHVAIAEYDIGEVLHDAGRFEEGQRFYSFSLAIMESDDPSPNHPLYMRIVDALGILHREIGSLELAESRSHTAYDKNMKLLGFVDPYTLVAANNYAETLHAKGDTKNAKDLYEKVLRSERELLDPPSGPSHPHTLMTLNNLGRIAWQGPNTSDLDEARSIFEEVIKGLEPRIGADHGCLLTAQANLARTFLLQGHIDTALTQALELRPKFETFHGNDHPMLATVDYLLGVCYFAKDDFATAKQHFTVSRALWEKAFGHTEIRQPDLFRVVAMLARTERALANNMEAQDLEAQLETFTTTSMTSPFMKYSGALRYADLAAINAVATDWRVVAPLAYGGTFRMRWGRKTCWREATETVLTV